MKRYLEKQDLDINVKYAVFNTPEDRSSARNLLLELIDYDNYVYRINGQDIDKYCPALYTLCMFYTCMWQIKTLRQRMLLLLLLQWCVIVDQEAFSIVRTRVSYICFDGEMMKINDKELMSTALPFIAQLYSST